MKKIFLILLLFFSLFGLCQVNSNHVYVNGYTRSNGTYVAPHYRTAPNSTNSDNFSTQGNTNPYTGKPGWIPKDNSSETKRLDFNSNSSSTSSISTYQKTISLYDNSSYQTEWINRKVNKLYKHSLRINNKYYKKLLRESRKMRRKYKELDVELFFLTNGWYEVGFVSQLKTRNKYEDLFLKRLVYLENGKITKYISSDNLIYDVNTCLKYGVQYILTLNHPDNTVSETINISLINNKPLKSAPEYDYPSLVYFYTNNDNYGGKISVVIESKNKVYFLGKIEKYWIENPSCEAKSDLVKTFLPRGKYKFYAENRTTIWSNTMEVNSYCISMRLTSN